MYILASRSLFSASVSPFLNLVYIFVGLFSEELLETIDGDCSGGVDIVDPKLMDSH